jgi:hypothetical protein
VTSALDWLGKADDDIDAVKRCLQGTPNISVAAYHCHQAAEKLLKALLTQLGIQYPRGRGGYDLPAIADLLPTTYPLRPEACAFGPITEWATAFRYPADDPFTAEPLPSLAEVSGWLLRIERFRNSAKTAIAPPPSTPSP